MLCAACKVVFSQTMVPVVNDAYQGRWSALFRYEISSANLEKQAKICYICSRTFPKVAAHQKLRTHDLPSDTILNQSYYLWLHLGKENIARLTVSSYLNEDELVTQPFCFQRASHRAQNGGSSTGSVETLEFVKERLEQCRTQHKACSSGAKKKWYPTRLIEVNPENLRLVETLEVTISAPYASLSHCWGGAKIMNLTTKNLLSLKKDLQFSQLPLTFQDAISVVRGLGINYIWIDSLCIMQDSKEDWLKEAQSMLNVYRHALLNIAATNSENSFAGLFRKRQPEVLASGVVKIDNGVMKGDYEVIDEHYFIEEVDDAPLNCRSWVTQERMLSNRIAHFASKQVIWDCAEMTACEGLPTGTEIWPNCGWGQFKIGCKQGSQFLTLPKSINQGLSQWARIVDTYSNCGLTFPGDKFIALSGMAQHLQDLLKLEYCAGLWRPRMEIQLAWTVGNPARQGEPRNNLAPSWSWVSINGAVRMQQVDGYEGYDLGALVTVVDVNLSKSRDNGNFRGEKISGSIRMRCIMNPVNLDYVQNSPRLLGEGMEHVRNFSLDSPSILGGGGFFFVPLFELQAPNSLADPRLIYSEIRGIILCGDNERPGIYTRCGYAFASSDTREESRRFHPSYEALKSPLGKQKYPCEDWDPSLGYLITLV